MSWWQINWGVMKKNGDLAIDWWIEWILIFHINIVHEMKNSKWKKCQAVLFSVTSLPSALPQSTSRSVFQCSLQFFSLIRSVQANANKFTSTKDAQSYPQTTPDRCTVLISSGIQNSLSPQLHNISTTLPAH